jgi:spoIIIJ-associated protein
MKIEEYISKLIEHLGFEGEIEIKIEEGDERVHINIQTDEKDTALLIGNKGETLSAIELLTKLSFKDDYPDKRIVLDINQYKLRQEERLKEKALSLANRVLETGKSYEFRYLNSYERHLVHEVIANEIGLESLTSYSEDRDLGRVLIIEKKKNA